MLRTLGYRLSGLRLLLPATPSSWTHALQDCCPSRALGSTNQRAFRGSVYSLNTEANEAKDEKKQAESPDGAASSEDGSEAEPVDAEKLQGHSLERGAARLPTPEQATLQEQSERLSKAQTEVAEMKDRVLRTLADMENLRTRTSQQIEETRQFALQGFAKDILDVADNLDRALGSVPADLLEGDAAEQQAEVASKNLKSLHNGVALSQKVHKCFCLLAAISGKKAQQKEDYWSCRLPGHCALAGVVCDDGRGTIRLIMIKIFKKNGLEAVECDIGTDFDPNVHNAMFEVPTADVKAGKIATIVKRGYTLKGRVIRAADVGIARAVDG